MRGLLCPEGQLLRGFDGNGRVVCAAPTQPPRRVSIDQNVNNYELFVAMGRAAAAAARGDPRGCVVVLGLVGDPDQADADRDGEGDACEPMEPPADDGDGVPDREDDCPFAANADQADADGDGIGDACQMGADADADGIADADDNCPSRPIPIRPTAMATVTGTPAMRTSWCAFVAARGGTGAANAHRRSRSSDVFRGGP